MSSPVRKAIFPVGGLGTRLPATKAMPKEMLPVVDKPLIQYAVEEAAAGIEEFVLSRAAVRRHRGSLRRFLRAGKNLGLRGRDDVLRSGPSVLNPAKSLYPQMDRWGWAPFGARANMSVTSRSRSFWRTI